MQRPQFEYQHCATCTFGPFYIFLVVKASGIMTKHGSHVQRHTAVFTKVMYVNECNSSIPLEFKEEGNKEGKPLGPSDPPGAR